MLKSIKLKNYKCFKDSGDIEIAPLTILCGVNSSGKSSILKSLLMLKQSYENNTTLNSMILNGELTNNGSTNEVIYNKEGNSFIISTKSIFNVPPKYKDDIAKTSCHRSEVLAYKELSKILKTDKKITMDVVIEVCNNKVALSDNIIKTYKIIIDIEDKQPVEIRFEKTNDTKNRDYNIYLKNFIKTDNTILSEDFTILRGCACYFEGMKVVNIFSQGHEYFYNEIFPNIYAIMRHVGASMSSVEYISPLRIQASRYYIHTEDKLSVGTTGENTAQTIKNCIKSPIRFAYPYSDKQLNKKIQIVNFGKVLQAWMEYIGLGGFKINSNNELLKLFSNGHNIADVGFGISQALPIIVQGLLLYKFQTFLIEQPEIHLHPKAQMAMADFLLTASMDDKNIIIETHSDHIINRVVRRVLEDDTGTLFNKVKIYFVNNGQIETIQIDKYEGIVNAPEDFFTQFGNETMNILNAGIYNYEKRNEK